MYLCALNPPREFQAKAHVLNTTVEIKVYHYAAGPRWGAHNVAYLIGMRNLPAIERHNICDYAATLADTLFELAEPTPLSRGNDLWESPPLLRSKL